MPKKEKKEVKQNKDKKSFFKGFKAELKKVIWLTPKQLFNNTVAVLAIVLLTAAIVFVLDFTFEALNKYGVNKLKDSISASNTVNETAENNVSNETSENETTQGENTSENQEAGNAE